MQRFAVIGLGRFGSRLATNLAAAGAEVVAIDRDRAVVEDLRDRVALAIALDATDEQALKIQGVEQTDCAVVGIGQNFEANALATVLLKSLSVPKVISRARTSMQAQILTRIGADAVVRPEDEAADRWSNRLLAPYIVDHVELGAGYALVQMKVPNTWEGKTLAELGLRAKHNVTVVAIKRKAPEAQAGEGGPDAGLVIDLPLPASRLGVTDTIVLAGFDADLKQLPR